MYNVIYLGMFRFTNIGIATIFATNIYFLKKHFNLSQYFRRSSKIVVDHVIAEFGLNGKSK